MRTTFGLRRVELQRRDPEAPGGWRQVSVVGTGTRASDEEVRIGASAELTIDDDRRVLVIGAPLQASDRRVLAAFATQVGFALDTAELAEELRRRAPWRRRTACAARCWPPSATISAPRSRGSRRRSRACDRATCTSPGGRGRAPRRHRGVDRPSRRTRPRPARHEPHPGRRAARRAPRRVDRRGARTGARRPCRRRRALRGRRAAPARAHRSGAARAHPREPHQQRRASWRQRRAGARARRGVRR